jgi:formamidopyrimidine-DNA glycosylase
MPELPEVETVRQGLAPVLEGARFARVEQRRADLRFPLPADFARRLEGRRDEKLERRAKYLLASLDNGEVLTMHLGMSGRFVIHSPAGGIIAPGEFALDAGGGDKHDHIIFEMSNLAVIRYNDARRFGYMGLIDKGELPGHPHFRNLGIEPLGGELDAEFLARKGRTRKQSLKAFLLDQHVIAGLGNIYVCEALFRAGLSPDRPAATLALERFPKGVARLSDKKRDQPRRARSNPDSSETGMDLADGKPSAAAKKLAPVIRSVLEDAIAAGGSSLRDYRQADGSLGYFQHRFCVYGREGEPCLRKGCPGTIARLVQNGRSTFYCTACQK